MRKGNIFYSIKKSDTHLIYRILFFKFKLRYRENEELIPYNNPEHEPNPVIAETKASIIIQDTLDLSVFKRSKKAIVFLVPSDCKINGGIMSIFSLCQASRKINPDAYCVISTLPNINTYVINDKFYNNEKILRFEQIVHNAHSVQELIIHIPECYLDMFLQNLTEEYRAFLKSIAKLQINIMNQNIELMPQPEKLRQLFELTDNITQTTAHKSYNTQEVCDKWQIPTHLFSVSIDLTPYRKFSFEEKEKIIVLSRDPNEYRDIIIKKLTCEFPDWEIITVDNMTFNEYMDIIGRAYFTITFGEGFDGYFIQPNYVGGLGISVYNETFFPDKSWKDLKNVYSSYENMSDNLTNDLKQYIQNKDLYEEVRTTQINLISSVYSGSSFISNLERFYRKEYDFYPNKKTEQAHDTISI